MPEIEIGTMETEMQWPTFSEGTKVVFTDTNKRGTVKLVINQEWYLCNSEDHLYLLEPHHASLIQLEPIEEKIVLPESWADETESKPKKEAVPRAPRAKGGKSVRSIMTAKALEGVFDYESLKAAVIAERGTEIKEITIKTMFLDLKHEGVIKL